jgi:hypothetical protein
MRIAIDLDKNYEVNPAFFDYVAERFKVAGHSVGVLTARSESEGLPVSFTPDFVWFLDCGDKDYHERALIKRKKMLDDGIDILFDDRQAYFPDDVVVLNVTPFI